MLVLLVGRLVIAVAGGVAGERRIPASCRVRGGGAAGLPLENCTSLFGIASNNIQGFCCADPLAHLLDLDLGHASQHWQHAAMPMAKGM